MEGDFLTERDADEGFAEDDSPDDEVMETNLAAEGDDELLNGPRETVYYAMPETVDTTGYSKAEVEGLLKSEPYQKKISTCHLCGQCWYEGKFTADCRECGGFPLKRPCLICGGKCPNIWDRDIKSSHSFHEARWVGSCAHPAGKKAEQSLTEGMQDLSTR